MNKVGPRVNKNESRVEKIIRQSQMAPVQGKQELSHKELGKEKKPKCPLTDG